MKVGEGNGKFLAHAAMGMPREQLWSMIRSGELRDLHKPSLAAWWKLAGRK